LQKWRLALLLALLGRAILKRNSLAQARFLPYEKLLAGFMPLAIKNQLLSMLSPFIFKKYLSG